MTRKNGRIFKRQLLAAIGILGGVTIYQFRRERRELINNLRKNSQVVEVDNGRIEYTAVGTGTPILVTHGTLGGYDQGLGIAQVFRGLDFKLIAVSRAGYLRSSLSTGHTPEEQADTYAQLLDKLGISQAGMIGVSGGGPSTVQFALRHHDKCLGLVLMSAITKSPPPLPPVMKSIIRVQDVMMRFDLLWWIFCKFGLQLLMKSNGVDDSLIEKVNRDSEKKSIVQQLYRPIATASLRIAGVKNDDRQITQLPQYPIEKISVPVLAVHSPTDPLVPIDQAKWIANSVPDGTLVELKDGGHICFAVNKERLRPFVAQFFAHE